MGKLFRDYFAFLSNLFDRKGGRVDGAEAGRRGMTAGGDGGHTAVHQTIRLSEAGAKDIKAVGESKHDV